MRALPWLGVAGAAVLGLLNLLNLTASAYTQYADANLDRPEDARVLAARREAADLTPWSARRVALHGWILAEQRKGDDAHSAYATALADAPADAVLWGEYAMALARTGRYAELELPTQRAHVLAPASPAVEGAGAAMALGYWERASPAVRATWMNAVRFELDHDREPFLRSVITHGRLAMFCEQLAPQLREDEWCQRTRRLAAECRGEQPMDDILCILND